MLVTDPSPRDRRGFTLIELLTVVVIIGLLAGLVTAAAIRVRWSVRKAAHAMELKQLEMALHAYKEQFGQFPPHSDDGFDAHIRKAFPRNAGGAPGAPGPANALTFWLGGVRQGGEYIGFSSNPTSPFDATSTSRSGPFFEFDPDRLDGDGRYYPTVEAAQSGQPNQAIHYYRAQNGEYAAGSHAFQDSRTGGWINPRSFQILSPGIQGGIVASGNPAFPGGLSEEHLEMMSNFTSGTMEDALP